MTSSEIKAEIKLQKLDYKKTIKGELKIGLWSLAEKMMFKDFKYSEATASDCSTQPVHH